MTRGDHKLATTTFRMWVATVEAAHRVRMPRELADAISWLGAAGDGTECIGVPGPNGGLQVQPRGIHEAHLKRFTEAMGAPPPTASEAAEGWIAVARLLATAWVVTIGLEAGRFSFTLPEPARRMKLVPQAGGTVAVFGFGEILEIWDADKWQEHVRATAARSAVAMSNAIEDLTRR